MTPALIEAAHAALMRDPDPSVILVAKGWRYTGPSGQTSIFGGLRSDEGFDAWLVGLYRDERVTAA